jgi:hypothetical protein
MSIEGWTIFWKIVFIIGVSTFAILSVLVIFGGAKDVATLIRRLKKDARESEASGTPLSDEE